VQKFLARQPIFSCEREVYGYELLYRSGPENFFVQTNQDFAAASAVDTMMLFGIEKLTQGRRAFVNCTREFLVRDYPLLLPRDHVVVEVLETVPIDSEVVDACRRIHDAGFLLALDDFIDRPEWEALLPLADFIKVDVLATGPAEQQRLAQQFASRNTRLLAEKVETHEVFRSALSFGYTLFQGYFFSRPQMLTRRSLEGFKLNYLRILQAANQPDVDFRKLASMVKAETSLSYRLLRYLNSAAFPIVSEVHSIPHALSLLGERGMRRWISLVTIACLGDDKPVELISLPLIRARFCELLALAAHMGPAANDLFLLGLLSAIDAILDMPMTDVLNEINVRKDIRAALLGEKNKLREVYDIVLLYERGSWQEMAAAASRARISEEPIPGFYFKSVEWANAVLAGKQ
jgi:c-di-GMP-related signal transduction protein